MRTVVMATLTLIGKVARIPDTTAVYQKMTIVRTELSQHANGTATEIQNIKDELKSLTAGVQKSITAGEEATAAAKEAAEVSKTVAGMARDIKNKSTQHQTGAPMSYAAVAAHGALAASTYTIQNVYTAPAPVQREIIVNIRNAQTIQALRAMNPRTMKATSTTPSPKVRTNMYPRSPPCQPISSRAETRASGQRPTAKCRCSASSRTIGSTA
jgi:hypothetical protein